MTTGEKICSLRKQKGITQGQLATKIGMTRATISNYERDHDSISTETMAAISKALNVSYEVLVDENITITNRIINSKTKKTTVQNQQPLEEQQQSEIIVELKIKALERENELLKKLCDTQAMLLAQRADYDFSTFSNVTYKDKNETNKPQKTTG